MHLRNDRGLTLIELVVVLVITGILVTVAMRSGVQITQTGRVEETRQELDALAFAIAGNPELQTNGARSDFGYVGDVGSLPSDLDALATNPGGYTTWRGPYIRNRFTQIADDYKRDAWGVLYAYSGTQITSSGSGDDIVRSIASSASEFTLNGVTGNIFDRDGTPPGPVYNSSISVRLQVPNGIGGIATKSRTPDPGGYFTFDSIPIGNHDLLISYTPSNDTIQRIVTVPPASNVHVECAFGSNYWTDDTTLTLVPGSDSVFGSPACTDIGFWLVNNTGSTKTITSIRVTWLSPTAYYKQIIWNGTVVFDLGGSPRGESGVTYALSPSAVILDGQKVKVSVLEFRQNNSGGGGGPVSMSANTISILLSDGYGFTEVLPICN